MALNDGGWRARVIKELNAVGPYTYPEQKKILSSSVFSALFLGKNSLSQNRKEEAVHPPMTSANFPSCEKFQWNCIFVASFSLFCEALDV